jgi:RNA polymerase sigma factor (sigma-70 family)
MTTVTPLTPRQQSIVEDHYHLVAPAARRWSRILHIPYDESVQAGSYGLIKGVLSGDPTHPQLSHWLTLYIKAYILFYNRQQSKEYRHIANRLPIDMLEESVLTYDQVHHDHHLYNTILRVVNSLENPNHRLIVTLLLGLDRDCEPRTLAEVGDCLGISRQAVHEQYTTVRQTLKQRLRSRLREEIPDDVYRSH